MCICSSQPFLHACHGLHTIYCSSLVIGVLQAAVNGVRVTQECHLTSNIMYGPLCCPAILH